MFNQITVAQLMNKKCHVVSPDVTLWQACNKLKTLHVGCLIVVENGNIIGMFSERDIVHKAIPMRLNVDTSKVRDVMSFPVLTIKPETLANDALFVSSTRHLRHIPVVDDAGKLVGLLGIRDLLYQALNQLISSEDYFDMKKKAANE